MPYVYQIDPVTNLVLIQSVAPCDVPSFIKAMNAIAADKQFNAKTKILFDTSLGNTPTPDETAGLIDAVTSLEMFKSRKVAVLAKSIDLYYVNKNISVFANLTGTNIKVFVDLHKAINWLDTEDKKKAKSH